ncbi:MAG TPA: SRPBCC family protein [Mycobacteriales bacterium]|nr:SRPBCC family protein [Mycobacteriales bacterium]
MAKDVETVERVIAAPPERIFALVADPRRHRDIDGSGTVREATDLPERLELGATFGMAMRLGRSYSMVSTVIEFEDGRRIAWQSRPPSGVTKYLFGGRIWRYELDPVAGGTRVRESWDITEEKFKRIVRPYRTKTRANMVATLERIDRLVTAEPATG